VFIRGYLAEPRDDAALARFRGDVCSDPPESIRNAGRVGASVLGPMGDWDWREDFHALRMPVLILHGSNDPIPAVSATEWKAAFPNSTLHILAGAGHFPQVEQGAEFVRLVNEFLR
jgi:pimeloyl-ACP methyl ester carboxylesterase